VFSCIFCRKLCTFYRVNCALCYKWRKKQIDNFTDYILSFFGRWSHRLLTKPARQKWRISSNRDSRSAAPRFQSLASNWPPASVCVLRGRTRAAGGGRDDGQRRPKWPRRCAAQHAALFVTPDCACSAAPVLDATPAVGAHLISAVTRPLLSSLSCRSSRPRQNESAASSALGCSVQDGSRDT